MFRRARLSVKPNVRPGVGARGSTAPNPQRGQEAPRPPGPAASSPSKPAESTDVPPVDFGGTEPQEKPLRSSDEKTDNENYVEESSKSSSAVSQRRKRISSTTTLVKPGVSVPSESHPLSTVNQEVPQPKPVSTKEKQPCSDRYRIYKAQKLREMLREELRKEKKQWKNKYAINESQRPPDRSKMTMRDFIYYLPDNNPMTSSLEQEKKTEKSLTSVQTREQEGKSTPDAEDHEEVEEEVDDGPLLVPRVKVAEDGSIILDEESLTVEVLRTKGPCVVEENDPIFERGSTTTYSSFRKNYYSKPWSNRETDMFFLAISMVGTDFSMIGQLFPHRARIEIKNKFKREEKTNGWRIDKAFQEKRPFDFDFFAHLLQKVLAEEEKRKQKSVKNQNSKEKKSSKPRKNVKAKKVAGEGRNDDPDESLSSRISDTEQSRKDAQMVEEEGQSRTLSEQDSEQIALEPDLNQKKKRRKNQDEVGKQEVENLSGNATVQLDHSKGEKYINKGQTLRPEINEDEGNKEQNLSCVQNIDDIVDLSSSGKVEKRTDPILLSREIHQSGNVKPVARRQLQRPKPNLSRAVGKKSVLSQGKTEAESKSLHAETPVEKNQMVKDKLKTSDIAGMEKTVKVNPEAETVSSLSEKIGVQDDDQTKTLRPARLMRGRLQRPRPNIGKAAERKEILTSQEKTEANVKKNESESCVSPGRVEDQSCKKFEFEDITSQPEKEDNIFQMNVNEYNKVPVLKTRFQKPKPNIGRGTRRRDIFSKEEVSEEMDASGQFTPALGEIRRVEETLPREKVSVEANCTEETASYFKKTRRRDVSPIQKISETTDNTVEMETDSKETGGEVSLRENMSEVSDVIEERVTDLKETGREVSLKDTISEVSDVTEERVTDLEDTRRREISLQEDAPEEVSTTDEVETGLKESRREISVRENITKVIDAAKEKETYVEETEEREIDTQGKALQVKTPGEMETDWPEIGKETSLREKVLVEISALGESKSDLKETGEREPSPMENILGKTTAIEETEADLKETGRRISLRKSRSGISATEEMATDLEEPGEMDISLREHGAEIRTSQQMETDLMQSNSGGCSTNISSEVLSMVHTPEEEKRNSEKQLSSHLDSSKTYSQTLEPDKTKDQGMQPPDAPEQFSDTNLRKSLPQEQKPFEVKPAPFVRSRFKRPKPNLARATLKRETKEAGKCIPGKKLDTDKAETGVLQQSSEQMNTLPSQHDVASLITSGEKDKSGHRQEEVVMIPCIQTEKDVTPSSSYGPQEESQPVQAQEKESVVSSMGADNINTSQQETKESVIPTVRTVRGRLQRPRPNIRKTGQRHIDKGEVKGIIEEERTVVQKDETKKLSTMPNSPVGTEVEDVSSKVSEGRMYENQSHMVLVDPLDINKINVLDEKTRHEPKRYVPGPAQLIRRQFQKVKPNLGRAHGKEEEPGIEKNRADQNEARKSDDNLLQPGDHDTQLLKKEKAEFLTCLEISAKKDCVDSREVILAQKNVHLEVGPSRSVGEKTVADNSVSSVVEEQSLSKLTSPPQLLKESNYSKTALDRRTSISSVSECEVDHGGRKTHRKMKPNVTRGRGSKRTRSKASRKEPRASKSTLVTLRASQEEDEDDAEDFEPDYEEENYHLAPEEVNKAPVFVPIGLRSPEPVTSQIEETMEEVVCTEAAITLLTMGDLVLQSENRTEQSDGVCVLLDVHSKDKSCVPFSPDNVNHKIVRECQELSSPVSSTSPSSLEENKIVLEEQSTKEEIGLVEEVKENAISTRNTTSEVTSNLRMRSRFAKPKPNLKTLRTSRFGIHQEVPNLFVSQGEVVESQRVNLVANVPQDGEDEQAFILTLVEIPTNAIEEFGDTTAQLMPNPLLPAPILIKSVNTEERSNMSFPVTSVGQDAMCLSDSGREDSEKPPANLDLITRKRFHCTLDESDHVPPAKKSSLTSRDDCQNYTSEECSKEINVEETGESYKGQDTFPASGSTHTTSEPQKEQLEPSLQSIGSQSLDERADRHTETSTPRLPQNEMIVSGKEEGTGGASKPEQMDSTRAASKTPLSRPGRRPLGFLSLICSKNSLDSDEPTHVYNKKRIKPFIPALRQNLKRSNPLNESQKKIQESSELLPSPSVVVNTESENTGSSPAQVSCDRPLPKEECKTGQNLAPKEGPTTVSKYFFSDIFIQVDES
uniref:B double prime 1, subunit of RNA polymerase III transcription initiation factor IIIB n=1 Tax=Suricata suricatta TaxID=37032 RepID=A0A673V888_SURSU